MRNGFTSVARIFFRSLGHRHVVGGAFGEPPFGGCQHPPLSGAHGGTTHKAASSYLSAESK